MSDVDQQIERLLLIVEDDEAFARTLSRSFERRGYTVIHAAGMEDMRVLLEVPAQLVFQTLASASQQFLASIFLRKCKS